MRSTEITAEEYTSSPAERFRESGRLFLVDYSPACAAQALVSILKQNPPASLLLILEDREAAEEYLALLSPVLEGICAIHSYDEFCAMFGNVTGEASSVTGAARRAIGDHPYLILTAADEEGNSLLYHPICIDQRDRGTYDGNQTTLTVADVLCECCYDTVVVRDVYSLFSLEEMEYPPAADKYDRLVFGGKEYYAPVSHSYRRLADLVSSSERRILLSDTVACDETVNLFAALELLHREFSVVKARRGVGLNDEYYTDCRDHLLGLIHMGCGDELFLGECMSHIRAFPGCYPVDMDEMRSFFYVSMQYMSREELFLRFVDWLKRTGNNRSIVDALEMLESESEMRLLVPFLVDAFLYNDLRAEIEDGMTGSAFMDQSPERLEALFGIFGKYGSYHRLTGRDGDVRLLRIKRDNSGFEHFVERRSKYAVLDEDCYAVIGDRNDDVYKCTAIAALLAGEAAPACKPPMLVVTDGRAEQIAERLGSMLNGTKVTVNADAAFEGINVIEFSVLHRSVRPFAPASCILFDVIADAGLMKQTANQLLRYGAEQVVALAMYSTLGGHLADYWQNVLFDGSRQLPFSFKTVELRDRIKADYRAVVTCLDGLYSLLSTIVRAGTSAHSREYVRRYNEMLASYTLDSAHRERELLEDVEYLATAGRYYEAVFDHTTSLASAGDRITRKRMRYELRPSRRKEPDYTIKEEAEEQTAIFFNACGAMLLGTCEKRTGSCLECRERREYPKNDFAFFVSNTRSFFEKTLQYDELMERAKLEGGGVIYSDEEEEDYLVASDIKGWQADAEEAIKRLERTAAASYTLSGTKGSSFLGEYESVVTVREAVYKTYREMLRKYYVPVRDLFDLATRNAIGVYRAACGSSDGQGK